MLHRMVTYARKIYPPIIKAYYDSLTIAHSLAYHFNQTTQDIINITQKFLSNINVSTKQNINLSDAWKGLFSIIINQGLLIIDTLDFILHRLSVDVLNIFQRIRLRINTRVNQSITLNDLWRGLFSIPIGHVINIIDVFISTLVSVFADLLNILQRIYLRIEITLKQGIVINDLWSSLFSVPINQILTIVDVFESILSGIFSDTLNILQRIHIRIKTTLKQDITITDARNILFSAIISNVVSIIDTLESKILGVFADLLSISQKLYLYIGTTLKQNINITDSWNSLLSVTIKEVLSIVDAIESILSHVSTDTIDISQKIFACFEIAIKETITVVDWWKGLQKVTRYELNVIYDYIVLLLSTLVADVISIAERIKIIISSTNTNNISITDWLKRMFHQSINQFVSLIDAFSGIITGFMYTNSLVLNELLSVCIAVSEPASITLTDGFTKTITGGFPYTFPLTLGS